LVSSSWSILPQTRHEPPQTTSCFTSPLRVLTLRMFFVIMTLFCLGPKTCFSRVPWPFTRRFFPPHLFNTPTPVKNGFQYLASFLRLSHPSLPVLAPDVPLLLKFASFFLFNCLIRFPALFSVYRSFPVNSKRFLPRFFALSLQFSPLLESDPWAQTSSPVFGAR